jgi:hypothetical protein
VTAARSDAIASLRAELSRWEEATAAWTDSDRKRSDAEIADLRRRIANIEAVGPEELRRRIDAIPPVRTEPAKIRRTTGELYRSGDPVPALRASDRMRQPCEAPFCPDEHGDWDEYRPPSAVVVYLTDQPDGLTDTGEGQSTELVWCYATSDLQGRHIQTIGRDPRPVDAFRSALALAVSLAAMTGMPALPVLWIDETGAVHDLRDTAQELGQ